jgi:hypothetical protein
MPLKSMSLLTGATITPSGGTAKVFADDGLTVNNGVHLVVPATADYRVRENVTFKYKAPTLLSDGTYTRDKKEITFVIPMLLASGAVVFNVFRISREVHPEFSAANATDFNKLASQMLAGDSDTDNFWATGSMA